MNSGLDHLVIENEKREGIVILKAVLHKQDDEHLPIHRAIYDREREDTQLYNQCSFCVLLCGIT